MGPREVEGNSFVVGVKPVCSESGTGSFKGVKGFPSSFDFVIAFPVDKELAFLAIDSILENLSTSHSSCPEASMVTGSLEAGSGSPGKALRSGLR